MQKILSKIFITKYNLCLILLSILIKLYIDHIFTFESPGCFMMLEGIFWILYIILPLSLLFGRNLEIYLYAQPFSFYNSYEGYRKRSYKYTRGVNVDYV